VTASTAPRRAADRSRAAAPAAGDVQRSPVDLVRVGLGLAVLGVGVLLAQRGELSTFERDVFRLVNDLPGIVAPAVWVVMQLGNVVSVVVVAAAAAAARRWRAARDVLVSGVLAYVAASVVKGLVGRERPAGFPVGAVLRDGTVSGIGFVSGHAAVAAAMAAAAAPYLGRRGRRIVWALAWTVALARVYVGAHLPLDVVGGVATGWAVGALVHWVLGVPDWRPDPRWVERLLERSGLPVTGLRVADVRARSSHPFEAADASGRRVYVKVLDPDRFERDRLYRLYRVLAVRDLKDDDAMAPLGAQAEHEAVAAMTARQRGVRAPAVLLARGSDRGAVVVQEHVDGRPLDEVAPEQLTPAVLADVWRQVGLLHDARVAHHDLVAASLLLDAAGDVWVVDFGNAETGAGDDALAGDVADLSAALALLVGPAATVAPAADVLGSAAVGAALPRLAPLALAGATRRALREREDLLPALRREIRSRAGIPDPGRRTDRGPGLPARIAVAAGSVAVLAGVPLLGGATSVLDAVERDGWRWLGGALVLAALARVATAAAALTGLGRRLAVGRTVGATSVAEAAGLVSGEGGRRRSAGRYLERAGLPPEDATRAIDRFAAARIAAAVLVAAVAFVLTLVETGLPDWRVPDTLVPAVLLGMASWALVVVGQLLATRRSGVGGPAAIRSLVRGLRPGAVAWAAAGVALEGAALGSALHGVRAGVPVLVTAAVYAGLHLMWTVLPLTGAPGAADVALLLVLLSLGAPLAAACAGVTAFRLVGFWLPVAAGALLSARLERRLSL
jgi:membrane-associated phospholipid phosphatase/uncharacterized membrane protein YbhN (UPF0104 family)